jgi:glutamine amidotransferase
MIAIVDYGMGNLRSAQRGLENAGAQVRVIQSPRELSGARGLVLPGDGAFGRAMENLRAAGWIEPLCRAAAEGVPFFGICVGMQLLFESSEEMGQHQGLGLFAGSVKRFTGPLKVPHMGWNQIRKLKPDAGSALLRGVADGSYCYFVHSYYCAPEDTSFSVATTDYGIEFASIVERGNIFGTQFHPEKSQAAGLKILENFVRISNS